MRKMVINYVKHKKTMVVRTTRNTLKRNRYRSVENHIEHKRFRVFNVKRVLNDYDCYPFGYMPVSLLSNNDQ